VAGERSVSEAGGSDDTRDWYAAADAFFGVSGLSETSLTGQLYRDNGIERAKKACVALGGIKRQTVDWSTARLLGVDGLSSSCALG
jgi:hypothetical protein